MLFSVPAHATGDPNVDGGGGGMGSGTSTNSWTPGMDGVRVTVGKLYLCGHDVPRDKEKAIPLLEASAAQGNIYAQFLLDHLDSFRDPSVLLAATRLLHRIGNVFREDYHRATGGSPFQIDRKRRRQLREKQIAQGHARDDHEQQQQIHY